MRTSNEQTFKSLKWYQSTTFHLKFDTVLNKYVDMYKFNVKEKKNNLFLMSVKFCSAYRLGMFGGHQCKLLILSKK